MFSYPKYKLKRIPETWPVAISCFLTQNMRRGQCPVAVTCFPTQNMRRGCTWCLSGCEYLFSHLKYGPKRILAAWPVAVTCFLLKIWGAACSWDLDGCSYLFSHPKYEAWPVPETCPIIVTYFPKWNISRNVYLRPSWSQLIVFLLKTRGAG